MNVRSHNKTGQGTYTTAVAAGPPQLERFYTVPKKLIQIHSFQLMEEKGVGVICIIYSIILSRGIDR